jgi:hypothetical protein
MVDGRGIYMSLPNLTQFKVKFQHGPELESIITLAPKVKGKSQTVRAQTIMTSAYPPTAFRACAWYGCSEEVLVDIKAYLKFPSESMVKSPELQIAAFYSKAADSLAAPSIKSKSDEDFLLRGAGRRLLCLMLDTVQWGHAITLDASGLSHRDEVLLSAKAEGMQADEIMADVKGGVMEELNDLDPNMFEKWKSDPQRQRRIQQIRDRTPPGLEAEQKEIELKQLRDEWVRIRGNQNLVTYYMKNFGFKPLSFKSFTYVGMEATPEMIHERCQANAETDGDCNEIIMSEDAERAVSQIERLRTCTKIRMLYLHDVKALPIVESLLPITRCLGLLSSTSLFHLGPIEALLTDRPQLTVQIDCLCLDSSDWSRLAQLAESEAWPRLFIRRVIVLSFDGMYIYDDVMHALKAKTAAIYHKVSGVLPHYMGAKLVDRAVQVKGEVMTDVGGRLYDAAATKINSDGPIV